MSSIQPVCLITGASAGIGAALAHVFAAHGHTLVLAARRKPQLDALAAAISAKGYARPHVVAIDLGTADGTGQLAEILAEQGLEPQYVINNAGFGLLGEAATLDRERQLAMIDLNVRALTDLSLRFVASVKRHGGGILNVASISAFIPGPAWPSITLQNHTCCPLPRRCTTSWPVKVYRFARSVPVLSQPNSLTALESRTIICPSFSFAPHHG